jgi:hypothetical protein
MDSCGSDRDDILPRRRAEPQNGGLTSREAIYEQNGISREDGQRYTGLVYKEEAAEQDQRGSTVKTSQETHGARHHASVTMLIAPGSRH